MKNNGFTLAEVLITLTIIGVIAALTLPSLNMRAQRSKVGPHLQKFINTMSNANEVILAVEQSNTLRSAFPADNNNSTANYFTALEGQVRGTGIWLNANNLDNVRNVVANTNANHPTITDYGANGGANDDFDFGAFSAFRFDSGESMGIQLLPDGQQQRGNNLRGAHRGIFANVLYDLDGFNTGANKLGIDIFVFRIDNNGVIIPTGGTAETSAGYTHINNNLCTDANQNNTGINCAGSIADNNWRVDYQY